MYSRICLFSKEQLKEVIINSNSVKEVLLKVGLSAKGGNHKTFLRYAKSLDLNVELEALKIRSEKIRLELSSITNTRKDEDVFCENSSYDRGHSKKRIINQNLLDYKCVKCGNSGLWCGETLVLQLEHINGISNDNRLENLSFLCPNCHSQTHTYAGKKLRQKDSKENRSLAKQEKALKEKEVFLNELSKFSKDINFMKLGWVISLSQKFKISHTHMRRLLKLYAPELLEKSFKRKFIN